MADFNLLDPSTWFGAEAPKPPAETPKVDPIGEGANAMEFWDQFTTRLPDPAPVATPAASQPVLTDADQLKASVAQIDAALGSPDAMAALTLSEDRGNTLTQGNVLLDEYDALTPLQFQQKYGQDIYNKLVATGLGGHEIRRLANTDRSIAQHLSDGVVGAANGVNQALISLANMGIISGVPEVLGRDWLLEQTSSLSKAATENTDRLLSEEFKTLRYVNEIREGLDAIDNAKAFEQDKADDENLIDSLATFGRTVLREGASAGHRFLEDPTVTEQMAAEGIGSLAVGGPASKGVQAVSKAAAARLAPGLEGLAARTVDDAIDSVAFPLTIGAMEGGGSALQAQQEVENIPFEDLEKTPEYRALVRSGMSPHEARQRLAADAGTISAPGAAAVGALTGKLVQKIEANPLATLVSKPTTLPINAVKEAVEEGIQSGAGELSSNLGVKASGADPDKELSEGVGQAIVEGATSAVGTTLMTQGPGTALSATAKGLGAVAMAPIKALGDRAEEVKSKQAAQSTVSAEKMAPAAQQAAEQAPVVAEQLKTMAAEQGAEGADIDAYIARVQAASQIQEADIAIAPDMLGDYLVERRAETGRMPNKFEALAAAAAIASDTKIDQTDRVAAATYILKNSETNKQLFQEEFPEFLKKVPQDRDEFQEFSGYARIMVAIDQTPEIKEALDWAREEMRMPEQDLSNVDLTSPAGAKIVNTAVDVASLVPLAVNVDVADQILNQDGEGKTVLLPEQRRILEAAKALQAAANVYASTLSETPIETEMPVAQAQDGVDFVSKQIEADGGAKGHQLSLVQHVQEIAKAVASGNPEAVKQRVTKLNRFALSHRNKLAALNRSIETGDQAVKYTAADPAGVGYTVPKGVGVRIGNEASERFARTVFAEATAIAALSNSYASQYPEFKLPKIDVPDLLLDTKRGSSTPAVESASTPQATTTKTEETSEQTELPLQPSEPARAPEAAPSADEGVAPETTVQVQNDAQPVEASRSPAETDKQVSEPISSTPEPKETSGGTTSQETVESVVAGPEAPSDAEVVAAIVDFDDPTPMGGLKTSEAFPSLVQPAGRNFFHEAFKFPRIQTSRMLGVLAPLKEFAQALTSSRALRDFLRGDDLGYDITSQDAANVRSLLTIGDHVLKTMKDRLRKVVTEKKSGKSLLDRLNAGEEIIRFKELMALNVLEKTNKGYRYNQPLVETAILAGLDWALNAGDRVAQLSRADVAEFLGIGEYEVTDTQVLELNRGVSTDMAARSLAQNIRKFWGVQAEKGTIANYVEGIPEGLAKEILHGLEEAGLLELGTLSFPGLTVKTPGRVWFDTRDQAATDFVRSLGGVSTILADMALIEREIEGYGFEPIRDIDQTQLRNPMVSLTDQHKKALEHTQAAPHHPNALVFDFFEAMGVEQFVTLMSGRPYKTGDLDKSHTDMKLNKQHWESIKGLQRQLASSFENVSKQMAQVRKRGSVPVFYKHHINKLGRVQMAGLSNPQVDKFAREIFMPTRSIVDLTDPVSFNKFAMTIGQGIGLKTEKLPRAKVVEKVVADTMTEGGKFYPLVQALKRWQTDRAIPAETMQLLADAKLSMHGIHSLLAVAKYELAKDRGQDLSQFETMTYLEADGKTNGPINALMIMASGDISSTWLKTIGKGGAYFGRLGKTLNSHVGEGGEDTVDLYEAGAVRTQALVAEKGLEIQADSPDAFKIFEAFQRFMSTLNVDVELQNGDLVIKRGVTKNPLTITIYGSGAAGIAGKVTDELMTALYEQLSNGEFTEALDNDLSLLTSRFVGKNADGKWFTGGKYREVEGTALDFELTPAQHKQLRANIQRLFVDSMREAIEENITKHMNQTTTAMQEATQLQSVFLKSLFLERVATRIAMKKVDPETYGYKKGDFLSEAELDDIRESLRPFSPIISTGSQSYFLSGGETSGLLTQSEIQEDGSKRNVHVKITIGDETFEVPMPEDFSRSLTGDLSTPAFVYGSTLAGVKAIPTLVVGSGDGQMILNLLSENPEVAKRVEHIFDGVDLPADAIEDYSRLVNEAVFKTWTSNGNPVRATYESYREFMKRNPLEVLFGTGELTAQQEIARKEISQTILKKRQLKDDEIVDLDTARAHMDALLGRLSDLADETDARRRTYAQFPMSVDQMASAESPFVNQGAPEFDGTQDMDYDDLAAVMNDLYRAHLAQVKKEQAQVPVIEAVSKFGEADELGPRVIKASELPALFKAMSDQLTPVQREMMRHASKLLEKSSYRLVFGKPSELDAWEQANNADRYTPNTERAKIDPVAKIILLSSMHPETVAHELIHAATIDKVRAFYRDPNSLSTEEQDAVKRIEGLMGEWLAQDPSDGESYDARRLAEAEIRRRLDKGQKPEAVNEFMAWVLSNQHLAAVAQKTKVKNPLFRIPLAVLEAIKTLIWGAKNKGPRVGDSILSNLRFNTRVLINGPTTVEQLKQDSAAVVMHQSASFGSNDRLSKIRSVLHNRVISWINEAQDPASKKLRQASTFTQGKLADQLTAHFAYHFPDLRTMQAKSTFSMIQLALMTEIELNAGALSRAEDLYAHVIGQLDYTHFMADPDAVPADPNDEQQARDKLDVLLGKSMTINDKQGRSSLMSSFLALATTSDEFRRVLSTLDKPKSDKSEAEGLDALLENAALGGIDRLGQIMIGESKDGNVREAIDNLMNVMIEQVADQRTFIEGGLDKFENYLFNQVQDKSAKVAEKAADVVRNTKNPAVKLAAAATSFIATGINEQKSAEAAKGLVHWLNNHEGWDSVKAVVADLVGRTDENAPVFDMISKVRATVQQVRQQFRDELPAKLNRMFKQPVSQAKWTAMFKVLGKTDLAALAGGFGLDAAIEFVVNDQRRAGEIERLEKAVGSPAYIENAKQLAHYMVTGEHGIMLVRNAFAIAALSGTKVNQAPDQALVDQIDQLTSLYALEETSEADRTAVVELIADEREGVEFVTSYLMGQRIDEMAKAQATPAARWNHYKGHIPSEAMNGGSLIIASDTEHAKLLSRGYTQLGTYAGSVADRSLGNRSYYFSPVSGRAPFNQGVLQTVHQTASGVDPQTGFTIGEVMAGKISDPAQVRLAYQLLTGPKPAQTSENLLPVFDDTGRIIAFERAADPAKVAKLDRSTDLAKMIGAWRGRQAEELLAQEVNNGLVDKLYKIWKDGERAGQQSQFVNIAKLSPKTDDPVLIEAAKLIPAQSRAYVAQVFGPDRLMVRRDMLLDTFGARQASVGDLFTGETRWNPKVTREFEKVAIGLLGNRKVFKNKSAYEILVGAEQLVQDVVGNVKQIIVVKSVIVPAANTVSNMFQLLTRGVPVKAIIHGMGAKTAEISTYVKRRAREIDLEADLRAAEAKNDTGTALKLRNQIQAIRDSYKRMSIWPLIEAGEFSAISQGQVTAEDLAMADGSWMDWVESKINGLKEPLRTPARYALITRDTALFQGLARAVQYGDFVAKAVLYDDLTSRKKLPKGEAIATVNEAFVNYNRLAGRGRQYLESVGLLWFYNYKLRIMKEAVYQLRHNPLRSLLTAAVPALPVIGDLGTPVSDNFLSLFNDGKLGYSIGPGMGFGVWKLNPWINLVH